MASIEITATKNLQVGDYATFYYLDNEHEVHEFSGPLWSMGGELRLGVAVVRYSVGHWANHLVFVRATREVPDLPTEPGSVIYVTEFRGVRLDPPALAVSHDGRSWYTPTRSIRNSWWHDAEHITGWKPAKVVPE